MEATPGKKSYTKDQIAELLSHHPDMTYQEIGKIIRRTKQRVHQVASETGLCLIRESRLYRNDVTIRRVLKLFYGSNLSVNDIAKVLGCHANTITNRLRAAGISRSESYSRRQKLYWGRVNRKRR